MALTTTYLNAALSASAQTLTLNAYTAPTGGQTLGQHVLLLFASGERCLVTDDSLAPTLAVVRGYGRSAPIAHTLYEGVVYGLTSDAAWPNQDAAPIAAPVFTEQTQEITATGATGTTAGVVTPASFAFLNLTGASGAGINLAVPAVGQSYTMKNCGTGVLKVYCVGGTINGTTGTTAFSLTATGNLMAFANCATAAAWQIAGNT